MNFDLRWGIIYADGVPRWWWCRYLPKSWGWAWVAKPIAFVDFEQEKP